MIRWVLGLLLAWSAATSPAAAREVDYLSFATEDEANSTEIFQKASPAVVHVTSTALQRPVSMGVTRRPDGGNASGNSRPGSRPASIRA